MIHLKNRMTFIMLIIILACSGNASTGYPLQLEKLELLEKLENEPFQNLVGKAEKL